MAKRLKQKSKKQKKVSTKPVGEAIKAAIKQLKAARAAATEEGKKHIDLNIAVLDGTYTCIYAACKGNWVSPQ